MKTKTEEAWDALIAAPSATAPTSALVRPSVHPFSKLGPAPYRFEGLDHAPEGVARSCALCKKRIRNLYSIADGAGVVHTLGSECVLDLGSNGFERHLVGQVKTAKKRYEKKQREARKVSRAQEDLAAFKLAHPREYDFAVNYRGDFEPYLSVARWLTKTGSLTDGQLGMLTRAVEREDARKNAPAPAPREFSLKAGETIIMTKFLAYKIGEHFRLGRPHFALEVVEVKAESQKAWLVVGKLAAKRMINCACCGTELTNAESRARGIGPICAEKWGVDSIEMLGAKLANEYATHTIETWIPKSQVKERGTNSEGD